MTNTAKWLRATEQLKIETNRRYPSHPEMKKKPSRLFYAVIQHSDENVRVFGEVDHQFLLFLHLAESLFVQIMREVKEQI